MTDVDRDILDAPIQEAEISATFSLLKSNKSPGNDWLPGEFYRKFKDQLVKVLQLVFSECLNINKIPASWQTARIVVIPKKGKDSINLQDLRPISLLNSSYQILMTIFGDQIKLTTGTVYKIRPSRVYTGPSAEG